MTPVEDMRWCSWCQETKAEDHDCVGAGNEATPTPDITPNGDTE